MQMTTLNWQKIANKRGEWQRRVTSVAEQNKQRGE